MDIKTTPPAEYAEWLLSQGVKPEHLQGRMVHDMLRTVAKQLDEIGTPSGFEAFKTSLDKVLASDAVDRAQRQ